MKILVATEKPFAKEATNEMREIAKKDGFELVLLENYTDVNDLYKAVEDVEGLIVRSDKVTKDVVAHAKKLKIVVRAGAGYDNLDLAACTEKNIVCMNTPGQNSNAVAELTIGMMLYMARNQFTPGTGTELSGKYLGIEGFGNIGQLVAKKAKGLGMNVLIYAAKPAAKHQGWETVPTLEELYKKCNYVSVNIPATPDTKGMIGYEYISLMPKGGCLVNTARKEIINEEGLEKVLSERSDLKYASDIAPVRYEEFKEKFGNQIYATPKKMGAQTKEANVNAGLAAVRQSIDFIKNGVDTFKVN